MVLTKCLWCYSLKQQHAFTWLNLQLYQILSVIAAGIERQSHSLTMMFSGHQTGDYDFAASTAVRCSPGTIHSVFSFWIRRRKHLFFPETWMEPAFLQASFMSLWMSTLLFCKCPWNRKRSKHGWRLNAIYICLALSLQIQRCPKIEGPPHLIIPWHQKIYWLREPYFSCSEAITWWHKDWEWFKIRHNDRVLKVSLLFAQRDFPQVWRKLKQQCNPLFTSLGSTAVQKYYLQYECK